MSFDPISPPASLASADLLDIFDGAAIANTPTRLAGLEVSIIRALTPEDLLAAAEGTPVAGPTSLGAIRHNHHRIAQLLAEGAAPARVSMLTGYSPGYVSRLQGDPTFRELLAYYVSQSETVTTDLKDRLNTLGLVAMDELQARLEETPAEFTKKDLMEIVKQAAPAGAGSGSGPSGPGVALNVQFVQAGPANAADAPVIAASVSRLPPEQEI